MDVHTIHTAQKSFFKIFLTAQQSTGNCQPGGNYRENPMSNQSAGQRCSDARELNATVCRKAVLCRQDTAASPAKVSKKGLFEFLIHE